MQACVSPSLRPIKSVTLVYRIMYGVEVRTPMYDDGNHDDGDAEDGVYGARIPASASIPGQMVRYYIVAADSNGQQMRAPAFYSPLESPHAFGTVVADPTLTNTLLPVLYWFIRRFPAAWMPVLPCVVRSSSMAGFTTTPRLISIGQSTHSFPKKSYDFHFNPGFKCRWSDDLPGWESCTC